MRQTQARTTLMAALLAAGCASAAYDPLRISPEEFRRRVKTIAVGGSRHSGELEPRPRRHTFASRPVAAGVDLRTVQEPGRSGSCELEVRH